MNVTASYRVFSRSSRNYVGHFPVVSLLNVRDLEEAFMLLQGDRMPFQAGWAGSEMADEVIGDLGLGSLFIATSLSVGDRLYDDENGGRWEVASVGFKEIL